MIADSARPDDDPSAHRPRKRGKYTQVAWYVRSPAFSWLADQNINRPSNECKRRKLKCSGGETCTRCLRDQIECVYPVSRPAGSTRETEVQDDRCVVSHEHDDLDLVALWSFSICILCG